MKSYKLLLLCLLVTSLFCLISCKDKTSVSGPEAESESRIHGNLYNTNDLKGQQFRPQLIEVRGQRVLSFLRAANVTADPLSDDSKPSSIYIIDIDETGLPTSEPKVIFRSNNLDPAYKMIEMDGNTAIVYMNKGETRNDVYITVYRPGRDDFTQLTPTDSLDNQTMSGLVFKDMDAQNNSFVFTFTKEEGNKNNVYLLRETYSSNSEEWTVVEWENITKNSEGTFSNECAVSDRWGDLYILFTRSSAGREAVSYVMTREEDNLTTIPVDIASTSGQPIRNPKLIGSRNRLYFGYIQENSDQQSSDIYIGSFMWSRIDLQPVKVTNGEGIHSDFSVCEYNNEIRIVYQRNDGNGHGSEIYYKSMDTSGSLSREYKLTDNDASDIDDFKKVDMQPFAVMLDDWLAVAYASGLAVSSANETQIQLLMVPPDLIP